MNIHQAKRINRCKEITYARRDAKAECLHAHSEKSTGRL